MGNFDYTVQKRERDCLEVFVGQPGIVRASHPHLGVHGLAQTEENLN